MYDKSLDAFRAVAEEGSFSKAAGRLYISHTAVIKQVSGLESRLGVNLFHRSTHGVSLTPAGQALYGEALQLMKQSDRIIRKVQQAHFASPKTLRIGTSALYPCHFFMDLWDGMRDKCPQYSLKIVPFHDDRNRLAHLGADFDMMVGAYDTEPDIDGFGFLPVGEYRFRIAVPRAHPLAKRKRLALKDLKDQPLMMMRQGDSPVNDSIRERMRKEYPDITLVDIDPRYDVPTFNRAVERNCLLLSLECWDRIHPDMKSIPLDVDSAVPYGIIHEKRPSGDVRDFLDILQRNVGG